MGGVGGVGGVFGKDIIWIYGLPMDMWIYGYIGICLSRRIKSFIKEIEKVGLQQNTHICMYVTYNN